MELTRKPLAAAAAVALALAAPAATLAHTAVVADPDEMSVPDRFDVEWVAVEHPPSVSDRLVRHTIKANARRARDFGEANFRAVLPGGPHGASGQDG